MDCLGTALSTSLTGTQLQFLQDEAFIIGGEGHLVHMILFEESAHELGFFPEVEQFFVAERPNLH